MFFDIFYVVLAILGLGFLVFIHELAHYFMAKRQGMRIEIFSIGFGKALYSWQRGDVKWQVGILPFGGYVKIAGMENKKEIDLREMQDGFFSKTPWQRMKVAFAGPLANLLFAFVAFSLLWLGGGRNQSFQLFTKKIGLVDAESELYRKGVMAGDEIATYNGKPYQGFKDLLFASVSKQKTISISGSLIDYYQGLKKKPFSLNLNTYPVELNGSKEKDFSTIGIESPANLLVYSAKDTILGANPSVEASGLADGDRLLWADGEIVFSLPQLLKSINEPTCLLTVQRGKEIFQAKFYKVKVEDLKLVSSDLGDIDDWKHNLGLSEKLKELFFLNYFFNKKGVVENRLSLIDEKLSEKIYQPYFGALKQGDKILAVDGKKIFSAEDILAALQKRKVLFIVQRSLDLKGINNLNCDYYFDLVFQKNQNLSRMIQKIGFQETAFLEDLHLLRPIEPISLMDLIQKSGQKEAFEKALSKQGAKTEKGASLAENASIRSGLEKELRLGIGLIDTKVKYNPGPWQLFSSSFKEMQRTLTALFTGSVHPKWMMGPVGIVQAMHKSFSVSFFEALFWLGFISLNLGLVNLLPLPVLDGGHILFSLIEKISGRPLKAKTMEKLIIPFIVLLVIFFIYMTYNDLLRMLKGIF